MKIVGVPRADPDVTPANSSIEPLLPLCDAYSARVSHTLSFPSMARPYASPAFADPKPVELQRCPLRAEGADDPGVVPDPDVALAIDPQGSPVIHPAARRWDPRPAFRLRSPSG